MKKVIYCFVALSFLLSGCGDNLSKGDAAEMIKAEEERMYSFPMYAQFAAHNFSNMTAPSFGQKQINLLKNEGYLLDSGFSEKAMPFVKEGSFITLKIYLLQLATIDKVIINSISKPEDRNGHRFCETQAEIKYKLNAIGEKLQISSDELTQIRKYTFTLKGEKWRLNTAWG